MAAHSSGLVTRFWRRIVAKVLSLLGVAALHLRPLPTPRLPRKFQIPSHAERAQPEAATEALLPVLVLPQPVRGGASAQRRDCAAEVGERRAPVGRDAGRVARPLDGAVAELQDARVPRQRQALARRVAARHDHGRRRPRAGAHDVAARAAERAPAREAADAAGQLQGGRPVARASREGGAEPRRRPPQPGERRARPAPAARARRVPAAAAGGAAAGGGAAAERDAPLARPQVERALRPRQGPRADVPPRRRHRPRRRALEGRPLVERLLPAVLRARARPARRGRRRLHLRLPARRPRRRVARRAAHRARLAHHRWRPARDADVVGHARRPAQGAQARLARASRRARWRW